MTRRLSAFTLIELIVVMAIIVTLSVIGFISYNSYIRDARNATRQSQLDEAVASIDRFIFNNARAPKCRTNPTTVASGPQVCYFTPYDGTNDLNTAKTNAMQVVPTGVGYSVTALLPFNGVTSKAIGVDGLGTTSDWSQLNLKSNPVDPRGSYYLYVTDGGTAYALLATKETSTGYATMIKGYKAIPYAGVTTDPDPIRSTLNLGANTVYGWLTTGGTFQSGTTFGTNVERLFGDSNDTVPTPNPAPAVPYKW